MRSCHSDVACTWQHGVAPSPELLVQMASNSKAVALDPYAFPFEDEPAPPGGGRTRSLELKKPLGPVSASLKASNAVSTGTGSGGRRAVPTARKSSNAQKRSGIADASIVSAQPSDPYAFPFEADNQLDVHHVKRKSSKASTAVTAASERERGAESEAHGTGASLVGGSERIPSRLVENSGAVEGCVAGDGQVLLGKRQTRTVTVEGHDQDVLTTSSIPDTSVPAASSQVVAAVPAPAPATNSKPEPRSKRRKVEETPTSTSTSTAETHRYTADGTKEVVSAQPRGGNLELGEGQKECVSGAGTGTELSSAQVDNGGKRKGVVSGKDKACALTTTSKPEHAGGGAPDVIAAKKTGAASTGGNMKAGGSNNSATAHMQGSTANESTTAKKKSLSFSQPLASAAKPPLPSAALKSWSQPDMLPGGAIAEGPSVTLLSNSQPVDSMTPLPEGDDNISKPRKRARFSNSPAQHVFSPADNADGKPGGARLVYAGGDATPVRQAKPSPAGSELSPGGSELSPGSRLGLKRSLLLRNLAAALGPLAANQEGVGVATNVSQAQEIGELQRLQDDAVFALDGLGVANSCEIQVQNAATLAETLATVRGRLALRADSLAQKVLTALAKLRGARDPVLALASSLILFSLAQPDSHPSYMASIAAAALMDQLLQVSHSYSSRPASSTDPNSPLLRVMNLTVHSTLSRSLPIKKGLTHHSFILMALVLATTPPEEDQAKLQFVDRLKANLQRFSILDRLASLAIEYLKESTSSPADSQLSESQQFAFSDPYNPPCSPRTTKSPSEGAAEQLPAERVAGPLWHLHLALLVLENSTFLCRQNEQHILRATVQDADKSGQRQHFISVLVSGMSALVESRGLWAPGVRNCVHACMAVLMNLTHQNEEGTERVSNAGTLELASSTLLSCCDVDPQSPTCSTADRQQALRSKVRQRLDLVTVCLGLLINLAASSGSNRERLLKSCTHTLPQSHGVNQEGTSQGRKRSGVSKQSLSKSGEPEQIDLLGLLCMLMDCMAAVDTHADQPSTEPPQDNDDKVEASIVEAYTAILLGFLMADNPEVSAACTVRLAAKSTEPVLLAVRKSLEFYINAGAITDVSRAMLQGLVDALERSHASRSGQAHPEVVLSSDMVQT